MIHPDLSSVAAEAVANWVASAAAKSHKYRISGDTVTFKAHKSYGFIGVGSTALGAAALLFVPDRIAAYVLGGIFSIPGVLIMLYGFVMSLSMSPVGIAYRGPFGRKKQLLWAHVTGFGTTSQYGDIRVGGPAGHVRIFGYLAGYSDIKKLLRSRFPLEIAAVHSEPDVHGAVFSLQRATAVVFLCLTLLLLAEAAAMVLGILPNSPEVYSVVIISLAAFFGFILTLDSFTTRLYIDDAGLSCRRLSGQKSLLWKEVVSAGVSMTPYRREIIRVSGAGVHIKINANFKDYMRIRDMVLGHCPESVLPGWFSA